MKPNVLTLLFSGFFLTIALADEVPILLQGEIQKDEGDTVSFSLQGENRSEVVGGTIVLGKRQFEVQKVSVHQLVGARRLQGGVFEYAVFSSSYSDQSATGEPWVVAQSKLGCERPYNSFLSLYTVASIDKQNLLDTVPYAQLVESLSFSDSSVLYCFTSRPPEE